MWTGIKSLGFPANLTLVIFCVWVSGASWDLWAGREHGPCCRKNRPGPFCSASARATKTELSPSAGLTNPVVVCFCECVRVWTKFKTCSNQGFNNMDSKAKTDSVCLVRISGHCCLQWSSLSWIKWFQHQTFRYLSSCVCLIFYSVCGPPHRDPCACSGALHQAGAVGPLPAVHYLPLQPESPEQNDQESSALPLPRHPQRQRL